MALRLVLVGAVAALGLTMPSGRVCHWYSSASSWTRSLLAGRDNRIDGSGWRSSSVTNRAPRVCEQCRLARARLAAKAQQSRVSANPATVAEPTKGSANMAGGLIQMAGTSVTAKASSSTLASAAVNAPKPVPTAAPITPAQPKTTLVVASPARLNPGPAPDVATSERAATVDLHAGSPKRFVELPANVFATPVVVLVARPAKQDSQQQLSVEPQRARRKPRSNASARACGRCLVDGSRADVRDRRS